MVDVTVRGAGIFGLSIAWTCARRGAKVQIVDPFGPGAGSSGGLVGALAPHVPENWNAKKAFQFDSLIMAEGFWKDVEAVGGAAGFAINEAGQFIATDWWQVVFNPSFPYRFVHMMLAAFLTTAFLVAGVAAYHIIKDRTNSTARLMFSMAMWMALIVSPIQIVAGDLHGLNTLEHQPMNLAAMEGHYESQHGAPLILFGWPDNEAKTVHAKVAIPKLGSLILTHDPDGYLQGLDAFPQEDWPNVPLVFWSFRVMVMIRLPPGLPVASSTSPSRSTMVGDMELSMRLPGPTALFSPWTSPN